MSWQEFSLLILLIAFVAIIVIVIMVANAKIKGLRDSIELKDSYIHRLEEQIKAHSRAIYEKQCFIEKQKKKIRELEKENERLSKVHT